VSGWRAVGHVILVLSLVLNVKTNINLEINQHKEGITMANTMKKSYPSAKRKANHKKVAAPATNCMEVRVRRSA
jgi:hypothetical protein